MSTDKVRIEMELGRDQPKAAVREHNRDMDAMKASAQAAERVIIGVDGKARDANSRFVAMGKSGTDSFNSIGLGALGAAATIGKAIQAAYELDAALKRAGERQKELAGNFNSNRQKLGELAGQINNGVNDDAFALSQAKFARDARMTQSNALAFRKNFNDSGAQFVGKTMPADESRKFEAKSAKLAAALGIDPAVVGDFMGTVSGARNFKNSDEALGVGYSSLAILQAGSGDTAHLAKENKKLLASLYNDDELKSVASSTDEVATLISAAAEFAPGQESENARAAVRATRDFTSSKTGPLLKEAGVTAQDSPTEAIRKLKLVVDKKAKDQKVKPLDVLAASIEDITGATALAGYMNKGVTDDPTQGIFAARAETARKAGPDGANGRIKTFELSSSGLEAATIANQEFAETNAGAADAGVQTAREAAKAKLTASGELDSGWTNFRDTIAGYVPFFDVGSKSGKIDATAREMLAAGNAGIPGAEGPAVGIGDMSYDTQRADALRKQIGDINSNGGNALAGVVSQLEKQTAETEKQTAILQERLKVRDPVPAPIPPPPPPMRRP